MSASSDYKLSIKIAGELEKSLSSSIQSAQKMLNGMGNAMTGAREETNKRSDRSDCCAWCIFSKRIRQR